MTREKLVEAFQNIAPVYNVGQHYKHDEEPYLVLKAMTESQDTANSLGGYQNYNIMVYVPDTSTVLLDNKLSEVKQKVFMLSQFGVEYTGELGEDFYETEIRMFMRYVAFRVPKQIKPC